MEILNYSDSAIYVYQTCSNQLPCYPELKLFQNLGGRRFDENGNKKPDTISPRYRINAYSYGDIRVSGTIENPSIHCSKDTLYLFFITESIMRTKSWNEICKSQLYKEKFILTEDILDSVKWRLVYD